MANLKTGFPQGPRLMSSGKNPFQDYLRDSPRPVFFFVANAKGVGKNSRTKTRMDCPPGGLKKKNLGTLVGYGISPRLRKLRPKKTKFQNDFKIRPRQTHEVPMLGAGGGRASLTKTTGKGRYVVVGWEKWGIWKTKNVHKKPFFSYGKGFRHASKTVIKGGFFGIFPLWTATFGSY